MLCQNTFAHIENKMPVEKIPPEDKQNTPKSWWVKHSGRNLSSHLPPLHLPCACPHTHKKQTRAKPWPTLCTASAKWWCAPTKCWVVNSRLATAQVRPITYRPPNWLNLVTPTLTACWRAFPVLTCTKKMALASDLTSVCAVRRPNEASVSRWWKMVCWLRPLHTLHPPPIISQTPPACMP